MRIAFVLPIVSRAPVGGFRVVYEYANRLVERGHEVAVVHAVDWDRPGSAGERLRRARRLWRMRRGREAIVPWMRVDPRVALAVFPDRRRLRLPQDVDALVATSWVTAPLVAAAAAGERGWYLIQGYETWGADPEAVRATWRLPLRKVVVSRWLEEIAIELGEGARTSYVPIGLDREDWGVDVAPESRPPRVCVALSPTKDPGDAIAALLAARARAPELSAVGFGTAPRPEGLPGWVEYARGPDRAELRALYNSCALFLQANGREGWGLPAAEAMACGCALVTYDTGGSREYAEDGETAAVVVERDPGRLAAALAELLADAPRRLALSRRGRERVAAFTWERSVGELERVLGERSASAGGGA